MSTAYQASQAEIQTRKRQLARDLSVELQPKNPERRAAAEADDLLWLRTYLPNVFYNEFTEDQAAIVHECGAALQYGLKKCKAAPRGDGKSSVVKYLALKYALTKKIRFALIVAATCSKAEKILASIKAKLRSPVNKALHEDYPLECSVARYVAPAPSRANNVTVETRQVHVEWKPDWVILPTFVGETMGPIIMSLGVTSDDIQGCNVYDVRPDFVMLDDLDSRDSLAAEDGKVAQKIEEVIDKTIAGLGGPNRRLGQYMLCTITSRKSAAFRYSDPTVKPAFSGSRISRIKQWPHDKVRWDQYIELRQDGQTTLGDDGKPRDPYGRAAFQHYAQHKDQMDAGAILSNPFDYDSDVTPDGTPAQLSALQKCYDYISDFGMDSFLTEHQNDPPQESGLIDSQITPARIQKQVNGFSQRQIPPNCSLIVRGIDVGKYHIHVVVRAVEDGNTPTMHTIDYRILDVAGTEVGSDVGLDEAIKRTLFNLAESEDAIYYHVDGQEAEADLTLVDARYRKQAVCEACAELSAMGKDWRPAMGAGTTAGSNGLRRFTPKQKKSRLVKPGHGWYITRESGDYWLVVMDTDRWKEFEHDRWLSDPSMPGALLLFGMKGDRFKSADQRKHTSYAHHITNEREVEEVIKGVLKKYWKRKGANHYLDASYMCSVGMAMKGIRLMPSETRRTQSAASRPTLEQLAGG